jgi:hypothetical protein
MDINFSKASVADREDEGTVVHVMDENGKPLFEDGEPVTITVAGSYSRIYRRVEEQIRKRPLRKKLTSEVFYEDTMEKTIACTLAWQGFKADGKPFELTRPNAHALYDNCPWIYDQVVEAMNDHALFRGATEPAA